MSVIGSINKIQLIQRVHIVTKQNSSIILFLFFQIQAILWFELSGLLLSESIQSELSPTLCMSLELFEYECYIKVLKVLLPILTQNLVLLSRPLRFTQLNVPIIARRSCFAALITYLLPIYNATLFYH